jgi:2-polyprenyl-3-methyl-5-hydroxy-6-metoxy-1,4-benzoquinol methylase
LHEIEAAELGDISGKRVLHLQCHIGRNTLCLVRRGAIATGLDFSNAALDVARRLSRETGLKADLVEVSAQAEGDGSTIKASPGYAIDNRGRIRRCEVTR